LPRTPAAHRISPIWNPETFHNTMVVNGRSWPQLQVEQRRYRFRLLNGCNGRFLILKMVTGDPAARPAVPALCRELRLPPVVVDPAEQSWKLAAEANGVDHGYPVPDDVQPRPADSAGELDVVRAKGSRADARQGGCLCERPVKRGVLEELRNVDQARRLP
jgi:hypothetical protein